MHEFQQLKLHYLQELPPEIEVLEITPSGASAWVQTVRIRTRQKDGSVKDYFKKVPCIFILRPEYPHNDVARVKAAVWDDE